jgi:LDH2 family malate/lactate/ureidoglycolate dehydrogenase
MLPGELEQQRMAQRLREGVPVAQETVEDLRRLATELQISCPL